MGSLYTYRTSFDFSVPGGSFHEPLTIIRYYVHPGSPQTRDDPGSAPYTEISRAIVTVAGSEYDLPDWIVEDFLDADEELRAELLANARDADECASDQAADARREELRMERP